MISRCVVLFFIRCSQSIWTKMFCLVFRVEIFFKLLSFEKRLLFHCISNILCVLTREEMDKINIRSKYPGMKFRANEEFCAYFSACVDSIKIPFRKKSDRSCRPNTPVQLLIRRVNNVKLHRRQTRSKELESGRKRAWRVFALSCGTLVRVYILYICFNLCEHERINDALYVDSTI